MKIQKIITEEIDIEIKKATLLLIEEAEKLPLRLRRYENWWWLRSSGNYSDFASYVFGVGDVFADGNGVYYVNFAVRPALIFESNNLKIGDRFYFKDTEFEVISENMAFCLTDIGMHRFDATSNNYEISEVKQYVDEWFNEV